MAKKKMKVKIDGLEISGGILDIRELSTVFTLAAIQQREIGHLMTHSKYMDRALLIEHQLLDQMGEITSE